LVIRPQTSATTERSGRGAADAGRVSGRVVVIDCSSAVASWFPVAQRSSGRPSTTKRRQGYEPDRRQEHDRADDVDLGRKGIADDPVRPDGKGVRGPGHEVRDDEIVDRQREREQGG